jgi:hypothetical protein
VSVRAWSPGRQDASSRRNGMGAARAWRAPGHARQPAQHGTRATPARPGRDGRMAACTSHRRRGPCHGWLSVVRRTGSVVAVAAVDVGQVVVPGAKLAGPAGRGRVGGTRLLTGPGGKRMVRFVGHTGLDEQVLGLLVGLAQQAEEAGGAGGGIGLLEELSRGIGRVVGNAARQQ